MTTAQPQGSVIDAGALFGDYLDHVTGLGLGGRALRDRTSTIRCAVLTSRPLTSATAW